MGASASTEEVSGIRVFSVTPASPAAEAGLETFFDFIVECNGTRFDNPANRQAFTKIIQESEGGMAKMKVFNTRVHDVREVTVLPRRWAGSGLLGASVRHDVAEPGENHGIRVLEVFQNSPAARAGLVSFQDFMLGTPDRVFHDCDDLAEVLLSNLGKQLQVHVYNITTELTRKVTLEPNNHWGGEGCIGCGTGTGLLHRLPAPRYPPGFIRGAPGQLPAGVAAPGGIPPVVPAAPVAWAPAAVPAATNGVPAPAGFPAVPGVAARPAPPAAAPPDSTIPELPPVAPWPSMQPPVAGVDDAAAVAATTPMSAAPTSGGPSPARQGALSTPMSGSPDSPAQEAPEEEGAAAVTVESPEPVSTHPPREAEEEPEEAGNKGEVVASSVPPKARAKKLRAGGSIRRPRTRAAIDEELVAKILAAPTVADLDALEPSREEKTLSWMVWMAHRAHMDDPKLTCVDFTNMRMPTGREEQRIAPKLVQAMATNTHISALLLNSSNLQGTEGSALGSALKSNKTLRELNIDSNFLGGRDLENLAGGIAECPTLEQVRCNNQHPGPAGRSAVDAFVKAVRANSSILKLGLSTEHQNSAIQLNQAIMRNTELARMKRKDDATAAGTAARAKAKA